MSDLFEYIKDRANVKMLREELEPGEYFVAYDFCGGNYDDCYENGSEDGWVELARHLVNTFNEDGSKKEK